MIKNSFLIKKITFFIKLKYKNEAFFLEKEKKHLFLQKHNMLIINNLCK